MPVYSYEFEDGTIVEEMEHIFSEPTMRLKHPVTGEFEPVKRIVGSDINVIFKGKDWTPKKLSRS